jgi:hypothetical protein
MLHTFAYVTMHSQFKLLVPHMLVIDDGFMEWKNSQTELRLRLLFWSLRALIIDDGSTGHGNCVVSGDECNVPNRAHSGYRSHDHHVKSMALYH